jgi:DNA-binding beta-propeller fold protein YncE
MRTYQAIVIALLLVAARISGSAPPNASVSKGMEKDLSGHLNFVREFSSAQDVQEVLHPVLNRSLDIIAGRKQAEPVIDALQEPYSVTTDSTHRIFVTDIGAGAVHIFDFVHSSYSLLRGGDHLRSPVAVAADHEGNVYVSDSSLHEILVYDSRGKFVHYLTKSPGGESYFDTPRGIAVDAATKHLYVCDTARHMVIVLNKKGHVLARFGKRFGGIGPGEFRSPTQVAAAGDEIVVLDSGNSRLQIMDVRGHFRKEIRLRETSDRAGLAMDSDRNIYVTDPYLNRFQVLNHDGQLLYEFGQAGKDVGQFNGISGIWVDRGHCLYVVDTNNKRVQLFQIRGPNTDGC